MYSLREMTLIEGDESGDAEEVRARRERPRFIGELGGEEE